jgi:photosystem II stability/assembly factor-like uncharacterized protein
MARPFFYHPVTHHGRGERQMEIPSGTTSARVAHLVTLNSLPQTTRWTLAVAVLALAVGTGIPASAQDEIAPEPSAMAPLATRTLTLDAHVVDDVFVAVGERGHILVSSDAGDSWQQQQSPTRTMLTGVYFSDRDNGWVVGHDSAILRTTDGGATWELVSWAPDDEAPFFHI